MQPASCRGTKRSRAPRPSDGRFRWRGLATGGDFPRVSDEVIERARNRCGSPSAFIPSHTPRLSTARPGLALAGARALHLSRDFAQVYRPALAVARATTRRELTDPRCKLGPMCASKCVMPRQVRFASTPEGSSENRSAGPGRTPSDSRARRLAGRGHRLRNDSSSRWAVLPSGSVRSRTRFSGSAFEPRPPSRAAALRSSPPCASPSSFSTPPPPSPSLSCLSTLRHQCRLNGVDQSFPPRRPSLIFGARREYFRALDHPSRAIWGDRGGSAESRCSASMED